MSETPICVDFYPDVVTSGDDCVDLSVIGSGGCDDPMTFSVQLNISDEENNVLQCLPDGLYGAPEVLCYRLEFHNPGELCVTDESCVAYELIPANTTITMTDGFLNEPSVGSSVVYELKNSSGTTISTMTIPPGATTGSWSPQVITSSSDMYVTAVATSVGSSYPGCGLSQSALICEPGSAFAAGGIGSGNGGGGIQEIEGLDTSCIQTIVTGVGTASSPIQVSAVPIIDSISSDNILECTPNGLYVSATTASGQAISELTNSSPGVYTHNNGSVGGVDLNIVVPVKCDGTAFAAGETVSPCLASSVVTQSGTAFEIDNNNAQAVLRLDPSVYNERISIGPNGGLYSGAEHHSVGLSVPASDFGARFSGGFQNVLVNPIGVPIVLRTLNNRAVIANPSSCRDMNLKFDGTGKLGMSVNLNQMSSLSGGYIDYSFAMYFEYNINGGPWQLWDELRYIPFGPSVVLSPLNNIESTCRKGPTSGFFSIPAGGFANISMRMVYIYETPGADVLPIERIEWEFPEVNFLGITE